MLRRTGKPTLQAAICALQFLTRIPMPIQLDYTPALFRRSVVFYPFVGGVIGIILSAFAYGAGMILPVGPAAVLTLILWVALSGGFHLDGWMDTADGLLSHRSPDKMLEIMKDSRVGAMGVMAAVLLLLAKASFLTSLLSPVHLAGLTGQQGMAGGSLSLTGGALALFAPSAQGGASAFLLLAVIPVWSRWWMVIGMAGWPYARKESGLGSLFREVGLRQAAGSALSAGMTTLLLTALYAIVLSPGESTSALAILLTAFVLSAAALLIVFLVGWPFARAVHRKLGGLTGDIYGAMNEGLEAVLLLAALLFSVWFR
ncbi:adenosylcobinamide-GDP ribazoletransferase [Gorillibacterium sp. CAU 1737]|uniref:adenosylcobinamide-GDP ribazoletransferase n=1 Tax=Gorillibacterium sp. CAU 1737 TaxID=3140362 RepID=UPI003260EAF9